VDIDYEALKNPSVFTTAVTVLPSGVTAKACNVNGTIVESAPPSP
jgi:hypothetical protein